MVKHIILLKDTLFMAAFLIFFSFFMLDIFCEELVAILVMANIFKIYCYPYLLTRQEKTEKP